MQSSGEQAQTYENASFPHQVALTLPFTVTGEVIRGKQLGSKLGFPTANIRYDANRSAWPAEGVYAGIAYVRDALYLCILNQGKHPTTPEGVPTVEAHLLDYSGGELYSEQITLEYLHYLRPEQTFPSLEALTGQLNQDKQAARAWAQNNASLLSKIAQKERS